jgi:hypothetical protein
MASQPCLYCGEPVTLEEFRTPWRAPAVITAGQQLYFHRRCREVRSELGRITYEEK